MDLPVGGSAFSLSDHDWPLPTPAPITPRSSPPKAPALAGLDYSKCSAEELKGFMKVRKLKSRKVPYALNGASIKMCHIHALEQADHRARFRLLYLPAELRIGIYEALLLFPKSKAACQPQILATCSQLRKEATKTLYDSNALAIEVKKDFRPNGGPGRWNGEVSIQCGHFVERFPTKFREDGRSALNRATPAYMLKLPLKRLHLELDLTHYERCLDPETNATMAGLLYVVCSSLQRGSSGGGMVIDADITMGRQTVAQDQILRLVHPLCKLVANFNVSFSGFKSCPELPRMLVQQAEANSQLYKDNHYFRSFLVWDEVIALDEVAKFLRLSQWDMRRLIELCDLIGLPEKADFSTVKYEQHLEQFNAGARELCDEAYKAMEELLSGLSDVATDVAQLVEVRRFAHVCCVEGWLRYAGT